MQLILPLLFAVTALAGEPVKDFNRALSEGVQKDLKSDNAEDLKVRPTRGPASVAPAPRPLPKEEPRLDKNHRQLGGNRW